MENIKIREEGKTANEEVYKKILELIPKNKNIKILDAGCGIGNLSKRLLDIGFKDITALDIINELRVEVPFKRADLNLDLDMDKNLFDLIICQEVIEHLENPRHLLRELKKILKERGIMIITTPNVFNWKARVYYLLKGVIWGFRIKDYEISGHITPITRYDFRRICHEEDLKIVRITYNNTNKEIFGNNLIIVIEK